MQARRRLPSRARSAWFPDAAPHAAEKTGSFLEEFSGKQQNCGVCISQRGKYGPPDSGNTPHCFLCILEYSRPMFRRLSPIGGHTRNNKACGAGLTPLLRSWVTPSSPPSYGPLRPHLPTVSPVSSSCLFVGHNLFFELICKNFICNAERICQKQERPG